MERDIAVDYEESLAATIRLHHGEASRLRESVAIIYYEMLQKQLKKLCDKVRSRYWVHCYTNMGIHERLKTDCGREQMMVALVVLISHHGIL